MPDNLWRQIVFSNTARIMVRFFFKYIILDRMGSLIIGTYTGSFLRNCFTIKYRIHVRTLLIGYKILKIECFPQA